MISAVAMVMLAVPMRSPLPTTFTVAGPDETVSGTVMSKDTLPLLLMASVSPLSVLTYTPSTETSLRSTLPRAVKPSPSMDMVWRGTTVVGLTVRSLVPTVMFWEGRSVSSTLTAILRLPSRVSPLT